MKGSVSLGLRVLTGACVVGTIVFATAPLPAQTIPWGPPLGVPAPSFGVVEQPPAAPSSWTSERAGFYYVDNTHSLATDSLQYGYPGRPRRSIPTGVAAGAVVEVRGGPYTITNDLSIGGNGTAAAPIFYKGVGRPRITSTARSVNIYGAYVIAAGFEFVATQVVLVGHHNAVRDSEMRGLPPAPGGSAIWTGNGSSDIVVLRNYIHHNGDPNATVENDIHGVLVGYGANRVWVVDNEMHDNGGDSVQVNSGSSTLARFVYIARNRMHDEGENAVDIKTAQDVIVTQNACWAFEVAPGSDGTAIVVNDDNASNGLNNRIIIIFNELSNSAVGVRTQAYAYVVGNVIRQIQNAAILSYGAHDIHVEHNTIYGVGRGLERSAGNVGNRVTFGNNIVNTRTWDDVRIVGNATSSSVLAYSLFQSPAIISWGGGTFSLTSFVSTHGCTGCREGSPRFVSPSTNDLRLGTGSPAIGTALASSFYSWYQTQYGVNIAVDAAGKSRPGTDGKWDMGAFESDGVGVTPPAAPTNLRIYR